MRAKTHRVGARIEWVSVLLSLVTMTSLYPLDTSERSTWGTCGYCIFQAVGSLPPSGVFAKQPSKSNAAILSQPVKHRLPDGAVVVCSHTSNDEPWTLQPAGTSTPLRALDPGGTEACVLCPAAAEEVDGI